MRRKVGVRAREMDVLSKLTEFLEKKIMTWLCIDVFMESPKGGRTTAAVSGERLSGLHLLCHLLKM